MEQGQGHSNWGRGSHKRGASAPPGRGYPQDTAEDKSGPHEEQPLAWRYLEQLSDDKDFLFPAAPEDDQRPIDMATPWRRDDRVYCLYCDMKDHPSAHQGRTPLLSPLVSELAQLTCVQEQGAMRQRSTELGGSREEKGNR